jgi:hypothetical protein
MRLNGCGQNRTEGDGGRISLKTLDKPDRILNLGGAGAIVAGVKAY